MSFELTGFKKVVRPNVLIQTGFQAEVNATMEVGGLTETVEVLRRGAHRRHRRTTTGAPHSTARSWTTIPTARDPWQIINMAAGVQTNDVNVGGNRAPGSS